MSLNLRKPEFCIWENKAADQFCGSRTTDQPFFRYTDSTIRLLSKSEISSLWPSSVALQLGLCRTWSETPKHARMQKIFSGGGGHLKTRGGPTNFTIAKTHILENRGGDWTPYPPLWIRPFEDRFSQNELKCQYNFHNDINQAAFNISVRYATTRNYFVALFGRNYQLNKKTNGFIHHQFYFCIRVFGKNILVIW